MSILFVCAIQVAEVSNFCYLFYKNSSSSQADEQLIVSGCALMDGVVSVLLLVVFATFFLLLNQKRKDYLLLNRLSRIFSQTRYEIALICFYIVATSAQLTLWFEALPFDVLQYRQFVAFDALFSLYFDAFFAVIFVPMRRVRLNS